MTGRRLDVVVVGAGPAGLAAGMQLARRGISHVVLERQEPGGLLGVANLVENYPGFTGPGAALAEIMVAHARRAGAALEPGEVETLDCCPGGGFRLSQAGGATLHAAGVVLATGTSPLPLGVPGATEASRAGLLHLDVRDTLPGATTLVTCGGDAALDGALRLSRQGAPVTVAFRSDHPKGLPLLVARCQGAGVKLLPRATIEAMETHDGGLRLHLSGEGSPRMVEQVLVCHGRVPRDDLLRYLPPPVRLHLDTGLPGLALAGDLIRGSARHALIAAADGLRAVEHLVATSGR